MPKKVHGRSAPKSRTRARGAARPLPDPAQAAATQEELVPDGTPQRVTAPPQGNPTARSVAATRRPTAARRTPVLAINYDYLRRDIRMLMVLAPSMIVLLVIAFFVLH